MFKILGEFYPSSYEDENQIKTEFIQFLRGHGYAIASYFDTQIRSPHWHVYNRQDTSVEEWHNDCFGADSTLVVWSNLCPTQVEHHSLRPYEVALWTNRDFKHRRNPDMSLSQLRKRWFIRAYIYA